MSQQQQSPFKNLLLAGSLLGASYALFKFGCDNKGRENFRYQQQASNVVPPPPVLTTPPKQDDPSVPISANSFTGVPQRPSLIPQLPPRFDDNRVDANSLLGQSRTPPMPVQGVPPSPTLNDQQFFKPDFRQLGSATDQVPGALTSSQAEDALRAKIGSTKPEYQETFDLLPVPDMKYSAGVDPTNPENFMYDRTIFGTLKRRYGNQVDFIRGDVPIKQEYRGWFDIMPATEKDVVKGYFDRYLDITQEAAIQDAQFDRTTPVATLFQGDISPWGGQWKYAYDNI